MIILILDAFLFIIKVSVKLTLSYRTIESSDRFIPFRTSVTGDRFILYIDASYNYSHIVIQTEGQDG